MTDRRVRIGVGSRFTYDGETVVIVEMHTVGATLEVVAKELRTQNIHRVSMHELLFSKRAHVLPDCDGPSSGDVEDVASVVLSAVADPVRREAADRAGHVRELLTGYRCGTEESARPGEPRREYSPALSLKSRYAAKASELGVGLRTIERWVRAYRAHGEAGLISGSAVRSGLGCRVDPRWTETALSIMVEHTDLSKPTRTLIIDHTNARIIARYGEDAVRLPSPATAHRVLEHLERQHPTFRLSTKRNRDIAGRSTDVYGKLRPFRPGEYLLMDSTVLDVFAMDPITLQWVRAELTVAMDWYTRCITGLRLTPASPKSVDAAAVLYQAFRPPPAAKDWPDHAVWPVHGMPRSVFIEPDRLQSAHQSPTASPAIVPETLVVDHGKIFVGEHLNSVCQRLGISIQPVRVRMGRDKGPVERFFRTLRQSLLQELPGYKGPDLHSRGVAPENEAFFYLDELESILRKWVAVVYHHRTHSGLVDPGLPGLELTPAQMFEHGIARAGYIEVPRDRDLAFEFLRAEWRTIQHYGVEIKGRRYNGAALNAYRNKQSPYPGKNGQWPIHMQPDDITRAYFRDPHSRHWHTLVWEHAPALDSPMSEDALRFARRRAAKRHRHFDDRLALAELLEQSKLTQSNTMAERRIALRLSREQSSLVADLATEDAPTQLPSGPTALGTEATDRNAEQHDATISDDFDEPWCWRIVVVVAMISPWRAKHRRSESMLTLSAGRRRLRWIRVKSCPCASAKVFEKLSALEG
jgi:transposase InsO family protein